MKDEVKLYCKGKSFLVTGGAGFIGSHLVEELIASGGEVTVVDNLMNGDLDNLKSVISNITYIDTEFTEYVKLTDLSSFDVVFHLAANAYVPPSVKDPAFDYGINLDGTFQLIEKLRKMNDRPRLVYASSAGVYGNPAKVPICEDDQTVPLAPYGVSKLASERYINVYGKLYQLPACSLRFFSVYGPRQKKQIVYDFLYKLKEHKNNLEVIGDGTQQRDFVYVMDIVQALMLVAASAPMTGEVYNVASGEYCSTAELAEMVCLAQNSDATISFTGSMRPGDADKWRADISKLCTLGYVPSISIKDGITKTAEWFNGLSD